MLAAVASDATMRLLTRITLWLAGLGFLGFGLAFLIAPLQTLAAAGIELRGALAATELRAFYGGLEVGLGLSLLAADLHPPWRRVGLLLCLACYGSIGVARGFGMLLAAVETPFLWAALVTELGLATAALVALLGGGGRAAETP